MEVNGCKRVQRWMQSCARQPSREPVGLSVTMGRHFWLFAAFCQLGCLPEVFQASFLSVATGAAGIATKIVL